MVRKVDGDYFPLWPMFIGLMLFFAGVNGLAYAEPIEEVPFVEEDSLSAAEPVELSSEPVVSVPSSEVVAPTVFVDTDGVEVMSSDVPSDVVVLAASSSTPYASVTGGTYTDIVRDMVIKLGWSDDYVFYRANQYVYRFAYGDLNLDGSVFTGDGLNFVDFSYTSSSTGYIMSRSTGSLNLNCSDFIVYSNLGDYPSISSDAVLIHLLSFFAVVAAAVFVLHCFYSFLLRLGVRHVQE